MREVHCNKRSIVCKGLIPDTLQLGEMRKEECSRHIEGAFLYFFYTFGIDESKVLDAFIEYILTNNLNFWRKNEDTSLPLTGKGSLTSGR